MVKQSPSGSPDKRTTGPYLVTAAILLAVLVLGLASGAVAQGGGLSVAVNQIDSQSFPRVTTFISVLDESGLPVTGLNEADFKVTEDGRAPIRVVEVIGNNALSISLVVAVDLSVPDEDLVSVQQAVQSLLNALAPEDRVALLSFANDVQHIQGFAGRADASRAVDGLVSGGDYTALNEVVIEAVALAGQSPTTRKAVIVVTDSTDNVQRTTTAATLDAVAGASDNVPIYIVGYGPKMLRPEAKDLDTLATATGGQFSSLATPRELVLPLKAIGVLLHQGYRIIFDSGLTADDGMHTFAVDVAAPDGSGRAEARFVAVPGDVEVGVAGLTDGETVGGTVHFAAVAEGPAPIASVEYRLDGEVLSKMTKPPYDITWDSTSVEPGSYVLTARAVDTAGNVGETDLVINVVRPVVVTDVVSPSRVDLGQEMVVEAKVTALADEVTVELLVDGKVLESSTAAGDGAISRFLFDNDAYAPGAHVITVRAEDGQGRWDESSVTVQFLALPTPTPVPTPVPTPRPVLWQPARWSRIFRDAVPLRNIVIAAVALIALFLTVIVVRAQIRRFRNAVPVEVRNGGNIPSRYQLRADNPEGVLKFRWAFQGVGLPEYHIFAAGEVVREDVQEEEPVVDTGARREQTRREQTQVRAPARPRRGGDQVRKAMRTTNTVANVLTSVGRLAPKVGSPLLRASSKLRQGQSQVRRGQRVTSSVSRGASRVSPGAPRVSPGAPRASAAPVASSGRAAPKARARRQKVEQEPAQTWQQTPVVEAGETLTVDLIIRSRGRARNRQHDFRVFSRPIDDPSAPLTVDNQRIQILGVRWWRWVWPFVLVFAITAGVLAVVFQLANGGVLVW